MLHSTVGKSAAGNASRSLEVGVRQRLSRVTSALVVMGAFAASAPTHAHHSAVQFDRHKESEFSGTVKSFLWTNPHSLLIVSGTGADRQAVDYSVEMNGPGYLVRNGWKRDSLKPGDKITVTVHPLLDGSPGGDLLKVVFADGHSLSAQIKLPPGVTIPGAPEGDKK